MRHRRLTFHPTLVHPLFQVFGKDNVINIEVDGNFDDCQKLVKDFFKLNVTKQKYNLAVEKFIIILDSVLFIKRLILMLKIIILIY